MFNFPQAMGTAAQAAASDTRYLRDDVRNNVAQGLKPEQKELWERHYPIGQLLPCSGAGFTADELMTRVRWYCKDFRLQQPRSVTEALAELVKAGLVIVAKKA